MKKKLAQRVNSVRVGLENCGLSVEELTTKDLIKLFYEINNPMASRYQKGDKWDQSDLIKEEQIRAEDNAVIIGSTKEKATDNKTENREKVSTN